MSKIDSMRSAIISCHGMASEPHIQSDAELLLRIAKCLEKAIMADPAMRGFLGYGGPEADLDVLGTRGAPRERQRRKRT